MCYQANELDTKSIHCKLSTKGKEVTPGGEDAQSPREEGEPGMVFQGAGHRQENATQNTLQWIQLEGRKSLFKSSLQEWRLFLVQKDGPIVFLSYRNPSSLISKRKQTQNTKNSKSTCTFRYEKQWSRGQSQNTRGWSQPRFCQCWMLGKLCILSSFCYNMKVNSVYSKGTLRIRIIQNLAPRVMLWTDSVPVCQYNLELLAEQPQRPPRIPGNTKHAYPP